MGAAKTETQESKRTRRHILINNVLYGQVANEATVDNIDNGQVIDRALAFYFEHKAQANKN